MMPSGSLRFKKGARMKSVVIACASLISLRIPMFVVGESFLGPHADAAPSTVLYVLSSPQAPPSSETVPYSNLMFVDPRTGNITRSLKVGFSADMKVSPDGKRVYVSSSYVSDPN